MHATQQTEAFAFPGGHDGEHHQTQRQRQPTTGNKLIEVRGEQRNIDAQERHQDQEDEVFIPVPVFARHGGRQN